jgi:Na+/alanine symporter
MSNQIVAVSVVIDVDLVCSCTCLRIEVRIGVYSIFGLHLPFILTDSAFHFRFTNYCLLYFVHVCISGLLYAMSGWVVLTKTREGLCRDFTQE